VAAPKVDPETKKDVIDLLNQKLSGNKESLLSKEIVQEIFSEETNKILRTSRFKLQDIDTVRALESHQSFFVEDYCLVYEDEDGNVVDNAAKVRDLMNKFYLVTNAIDGKAFDKMMDTAKMEAMISQQSAQGKNTGPDRIL